MSDIHNKLLEAIADNNANQAKSIIKNGIDLNVPCDQGASPLYLAILSADISILRLMLENEANPNFIAEEPAATIYTEKPLDLALQARFLMDWDKYEPVANLLQQFGATNVDGQVESFEEKEIRRRRAKQWQFRRAVLEKVKRCWDFITLRWLLS